MDLLSRISDCRSLSIIGMAKNTGKTVCLNYLLDKLRHTGKVVAVTSIGLDGEKVDQVTLTDKPEVELSEGVYFVTSEYHYRQRQLGAEICRLSDIRTPLGRLVTARVILPGKVILSGPPSTGLIREMVRLMDETGVDLTIVDGALSRKSAAAPSVTDGMILTTGAVLSADIHTIVDKTDFVCRMTRLPVFETRRRDEFLQFDSGIYALNDDDCLRLPVPSSLLFSRCKDKLFTHGATLYVSGIVTDSILEYLRVQPNIKDVVLVVKDFTRLFVTPFVLQGYLQRGGRLMVLLRPNLIAICVNPVAPCGYTVDSRRLCDALAQAVDVPVYDVVQLLKGRRS